MTLISYELLHKPCIWIFP